jgi:magnesium chelatase family protein
LKGCEPVTISKVKSFSVDGIKGNEIEIETDISNGLPAFDIVGLADMAVKESKERVRAAIKNNGLEFPYRRVTVNLAPAYIKKEGSSFDLPIAIGILLATGQLNIENIENYGFIGELSLDGSIKPVYGVLPMALKARESSQSALTLVVPVDNASEAAVAGGIKVLPVGNLTEVVDYFEGERSIALQSLDAYSLPEHDSSGYPDFSDVRGQEQVKRALEVAASGSHNLMMIGPPGSGKTMLAKRLASILPSLTYDEAVEITMIHSVAGLLPRGVPLITNRPFRNPLSNITPAGLAGGGKYPKPGEISLAHNGVLFLDELPEFNREVLDLLRQPLEDGVVTISRLASSVMYPSRFTAIFAANPCKCGYFLDQNKKCTCTANEIKQYFGKISGPLLDRIDINVEVSTPTFETLNSKTRGETSEQIRVRVENTRKIQKERYTGKKIFSNSQLEGKLIDEYCRLDNSSKSILQNAYTRLGLSARAHSRILKVARTIADMDESDIIRDKHLAEAISYRNFDRENWFR